VNSPSIVVAGNFYSYGTEKNPILFSVPAAKRTKANIFAGLWGGILGTIESQEMAANYKGPTRIYYDLAGRTHKYLPIPIYKCQGAGKVTLSIEVSQTGVVEKAAIIEKESTTADPCLIETAVRSALISRFNSDIKSPNVQTGTLTYHFVAQ